MKALHHLGDRIEIGLKLGPHGDTQDERITADGIVICAGVGSRALAAQLGDRVNIYPVKGYAITLDDVNRDSAPRSSVMDEHSKVMVTRLGTRLRAAGVAEVGGYDRSADPRKAAQGTPRGD